MAENREEILANFQGITAIEDVAEAILHLEEANWDLLSAINKVMPQDNNRSVQVGDVQDVDVEMIDEDISVITPKTRPPDPEDSNQASTSSPRNSSSSLPQNGSLQLKVHYENKIHDITMSNWATVSDLRKRLESVCGVPVCRQQLSGLGGSRATSGAAIGSLGLQPNCVLRLKAADELMADDEVAERLTTTYTLHVTHDDKDYTLKFPGTKTVQEVKNDIFSLTDIPVRHQAWSGWPEVSGLDETVLAMVGLDTPVHELVVSRKHNKEYKRIIVESSDSENSSVEEVEDAGDGFACEDDMFVELVNSERLRPLMSEHVEDEALGCIEFAERFRARYGPNTPCFFEGTLQDAIKESCLQPARERKLLGVYLHHEQSVLTNVFCAQLLGCDTVLHTLSQNFVLYGWDLTHPNNNNMLLNSVANALGPVASMTIRSIPVDRLPALVLIMRVRSNTEIYSVINGNVGVSELVGALVEAMERFAVQRDEDARLERERDARQKVKHEQDEAYRCSLEADRAKEEVKKQQELERNQEIERVESERQLEEAKREEECARALARVPAEPRAAGDVARIRVRLPPPHDRALERRFHAHDTLAALFDFLASKGFPTNKYKVISSWPRRDLTTESHSSTLKAMKLFPQETLMLEER